MTDSPRFLGVTKLQFLVATVAALVVLCSLEAVEIARLEAPAAMGAQTHGVLCVVKRADQRQVTSSKQFLRLTPKQREHRYGSALGSIPNVVIRHGLRQQEADVRSLRSLDC